MFVQYCSETIWLKGSVFPYFYFEPTYVIMFEVNFVDNMHMVSFVLFFNSQFQSSVFESVHLGCLHLKQLLLYRD